MFSPTINYCYIRILKETMNQYNIELVKMDSMNQYNIELEKMDFNNSFLDVELKEIIYIE